MELTQQETQKLIKYLNLVSIIEAQKPPKEMDEEFLDACTTALLKLQDKHVELSPEYVDNQVRKIFHPEEREATEPETVKAPKKVVSKKKIWLVAACIAVLVALFSIVSFSSERSVVDVLEDFFGTYEFIPFGKEVDVEDQSYIKDSKSRRYDSIEEAVTNEKVDLLFPTNTQSSREVNMISVFDKQHTLTFSIAFNDPNISMEIVLHSEIKPEDKSYFDEIKTINEIQCYICTMKDVSQSQANFMHNGNLYTLACSDRETLIDILENMEEVRYED